ncbi:MAG: CheR family methyltransferase [Aulosira sp. ZfuVER01]|nr:CheR family methyltransferase [Aulosira sp. ZfuVER01]MDZ8000269.1 CheR family methyltransferase [Aulosira sp. DedVER01a]MDZ8053363.1 CheR family methyltransferase [Aulosira sp. ZfuCHP01]
MTNNTIGDYHTLLTSSSQFSNDSSLLSIVNLLADTLGIYIPSQHQNGLKKTILERINALGLSSVNDYYQYLVIKKRLLPTEAEWQELILRLSVTESYFFRDRGQFGLLKNQIFPELIERKRRLHLAQAANGQKPTLRLWSAGCSTGEEAYSLAIILKELVFDYQAWDIRILGTDINQSAIALAQQGIYSDWSFRTIDPAIKTRYFRSHRKDWEIDPNIRQMVSFQPGNLMQPFPDSLSGIYDLDLIICRNVFIYFDCSAIAQVIQKFYHSLALGGFLLTGHTELYGQKIAPFQVKSYPQSVIYQKANDYLDPRLFEKIGDLNPTSPPRSNLGEKPGFQRQPSAEQVRANTQQALWEQAQRSFAQKAYADAIQTTKKLIDLAPKHFQAHCLIAEAYAKLGQYSHTMQACQQALQINPLAIEPYYFLAQIAEEQGDIEQAKLYLKRIIYLAHDSVFAYLKLGFIYEREGNAKQAQKTWRSLLEVLRALPQEQVIDSNNQQTVAELKLQIIKYLN